MSVSRQLGVWAALAAAALPHWTQDMQASAFDSFRPRRWRPRMTNRHVSVAAMKRHARKRRNVRARQSKR